VTIRGIYVRRTGNGETVSLKRAMVGAKGVEGDRYRNGTGTFYKEGKSGQALTLIEEEALEGLAEEHGIVLSPEATGRNVLTRGVDLNALVGVRFRVGEVECVGDRLCDPCRPLERRTQKGVLKGLADRGGLRADVLESGEIAVGDAIIPLD
jgi:MOSC domain-containing protein YiiM